MQQWLREKVRYDERLMWFKDILAIYREGRQSELSWWTRCIMAPLQIIALSAREMFRDRLPNRVAALSFFSVMSIIPLLSVVTALLGAFGMFDPQTGDLAIYLQQLFPAVGQDIATYIQQYSVKSASSMGGIGAVTLLVISIFLFNNIEQTLTEIWQGSHNRPIVQKFLMFYTLITLGPVLIMLSIIQSASAQIFISSRLGIDTGFFVSLLPVGYAFLVFTLMNKIMPNALVSWWSAALGGLVSALSFELAKWGFNQYVNLVVLDSYDKLYGALGLVPIFMLWVYVTWFVILGGAEIAFCYQNREHLLRAQVDLKSFLNRNDRALYHPFVCLEVLAPIVSAYGTGRGAVSEATIVSVTGYSGALVKEVIDELLRIEVLALADGGKGKNRRVVPQRPLEDIELLPVVASFQSYQNVPLGEEIESLLNDYRQMLDEMLRRKTARALLDEHLMAEIHVQEEALLEAVAN